MYFGRNTNIPKQNPVEPQVQGSEITDPIEIQSSGGQRGDHINHLNEIQSRGDKRKQPDQSEDGSASKYCRLELEPGNRK